MVNGLYLWISFESITEYPAPAKTANNNSKTPSHEICIWPSGFMLIIVIPMIEITTPTSKFHPIFSLLNINKANGLAIGKRAIIIAAKLASTYCMLKFSPMK